MPKKRKPVKFTKPAPPTRHRRQIFMIVGVALSVLVISSVIASWRSLRRTSQPPLVPAVAVQSGSAPNASREFIYDRDRLIVTAEPTPSPTTAPSNLVATAASTTQINLTWAAGVSASSYEVERSQNHPAGYTLIASNVTALSYADINLSPGTTYLYRVRARLNTGALSGYSNTDLATTIIFSDDPLTAGVTEVKAAHLTELRQAVNAVRAAAGLAAATWTDSAPLGVVIKGVHLQELRTNVDQAYTAIGWWVQPYTDTTLSTAIPVKKVHVEELRQRVK